MAPIPLPITFLQCQKSGLMISIHRTNFRATGRAKFSNVCTNYFLLRVVEQCLSNTYQCLTLLAEFLRPWQDIMLNGASACADAIQTRPHRLKMFVLYCQKLHRTKVPSLEKLKNGHFSDPAFLMLYICTNSFSIPVLSWVRSFCDCCSPMNKLV